MQSHAVCNTGLLVYHELCHCTRHDWGNMGWHWLPHLVSALMHECDLMQHCLWMGMIDDTLSSLISHLVCLKQPCLISADRWCASRAGHAASCKRGYAWAVSLILIVTGKIFEIWNQSGPVFYGIMIFSFSCSLIFWFLSCDNIFTDMTTSFCMNVSLLIPV